MNAYVDLDAARLASASTDCGDIDRAAMSTGSGLKDSTAPYLSALEQAVGSNCKNYQEL